MLNKNDVDDVRSARLYKLVYSRDYLYLKLYENVKLTIKYLAKLQNTRPQLVLIFVL